jgi:Ca-activated chloride channel family protein
VIPAATKCVKRVFDATVRTVLVIALLAAAAFAQTSPREGDSVSTYAVDVKLVNVFVTVTDSTGAPVPSLTKNDFQIFEDGVPQDLRVFDHESELPLSIVLAIDTSLSTRKDLRLELESARAFAHSILRPQDGLSLYQFAQTVDELVPFTSDLKRIDAGIGRVHLGSATALYDAVYLGSQALEKREGRKVIVVITDGGDTLSQTSYAESLREAQIAEAIMYSIIVVPIESSAGRNTGGEHALMQMSHDTGGQYYYAESIQQIDAAFRRISDQLRTQYLLAYYPKRRLADSDFRRLEVRVTPPADSHLNLPLHVRHRTGYYTSKGQ